MKVLTQYNFDPKLLINSKPSDIFEFKRRDAIFAAAVKHQGKIFAIRDHLGTIPLYYRKLKHKYLFSIFLNDLLTPTDKIDSYGLATFLTFGNTKLYPLIKGIKIVPPGSFIEINLKTGTQKTKYLYRFKTQKGLRFQRLSTLINTLDSLMLQATERQVQAKHVGLYTSGGIDSALVGIYLQRLGVNVNCYTSTSIGDTDPEVKFSLENSKRFAAHSHTIDHFRSKDFPTTLNHYFKYYPNPHESEITYPIINLWQNSDIRVNKQVFFGQNSDTMLASVETQSDTWVLSLLHKTIRQKLSKQSRYENITENFIGYLSKHILNSPYQLINSLKLDRKSYNSIAAVSIAGMLVGHTPRDGETLSLPVLSQRLLIGNPYYDVDLIEFALGLPLQHRLIYNHHHLTKLSLSKNIIRQLALQFLPPEVVYRKKSFSMPIKSLSAGTLYFDQLPNKINQIVPTDLDSKIAGKVLIDWCNNQHLVKSLNFK